jgi:fumarate hydratase subunit alpha
VRLIDFEQVVQTVEQLCISACHQLPEDVLDALKKASASERNPRAAKILKALLENANIASSEQIPLCQDTGIVVVFVEHGNQAALKATNSKTIVDAINAGIESGYKNGYLRMGVIGDPLRRKNTGTNTPAIIHTEFTSGDKIKITVMTKGGGCENKSQFRMFTPTTEKEQITEWIVDVVRSAGADVCPPVIVGVGIGGNFEQSCLLSKRALLRKLGERNKEVFYAQMEEDLLSRINSLGIGPQGLGGDTTALGCMIETAPCHIASLPVAVNIECHSHRHKSAVI